VDYTIHALVTKIPIYIPLLFGLGFSVLLRKLCLVMTTFCFCSSIFFSLSCLCRHFCSLVKYEITPKIDIVGMLLPALARTTFANSMKYLTVNNESERKYYKVKSVIGRFIFNAVNVMKCIYGSK
jgi:hypothetical protein